MPRKSEVLKTFDKMLPVALTDAELQTRGNKLAQLEEDAEGHELSAKAQRAKLREQKKALAIEIQGIAKVIREKQEERSVKCITRPGKRDGFVDDVRTDTNEVIDTRRASDAEAQGDLLENEGLGDE